MDTHDIRLLVGSLLWILAVGYLVSEAFTAEAWSTPYSYVHNSISDLGVTDCVQVCSPLHWYMNISFVVMGLLMTAGAILLRRHIPRGRRRRWAVGLAIVIGVSTAATGFFPANANPIGHFVAVLPGFVGRHILLILVAWVLWRRMRWTAVWTTVCALIGLVGGVLLAFPDAYFGLTERLVLYPLPIWMVVVGVAIFVSVLRRSALFGFGRTALPDVAVVPRGRGLTLHDITNLACPVCAPAR
ncbi:DUF998 domain-containing protein [Rhodococcus sp. NPDC058521]|uniref:DUF998 domain-containing protein n=1 Tax=Rhodococcus sp. NPDC058521 TaxID=3346536 RepID=UPI00365A8234